MKPAIAIAATLAAGTCLAQAIRYKETVAFGSEQVTLRVTNAYDLADHSAVEERIMYEEDPHEQERLARILWEAGDPFMLSILANAYERRMDLVGAYAHAYALDRLATVSGHLHPVGRVRGPVHERFAAEVKRLGNKLSATQRAAGVRQAAQLIRSNPNCCTAL